MMLPGFRRRRKPEFRRRRCRRIPNGFRRRRRPWLRFRRRRRRRPKPEFRRRRRLWLRFRRRRRRGATAWLRFRRRRRPGFDFRLVPFERRVRFGLLDDLAFRRLFRRFGLVPTLQGENEAWTTPFRANLPVLAERDTAPGMLRRARRRRRGTIW
jgi:hypothetical protein